MSGYVVAFLLGALAMFAVCLCWAVWAMHPVREHDDHARAARDPWDVI